MEPVTQQKNVVTEMVLPLDHALMVLVFVVSVSLKKLNLCTNHVLYEFDIFIFQFRLLVVQPQARIARI